MLALELLGIEEFPVRGWEVNVSSRGEGGGHSESGEELVKSC